MRLEARKYLHDIQLAADRIGRFCGGKTFAQYLGDEILRSAVERQLGIIGEALSRLAKEDPDVAAAIPITPLPRERGQSALCQRL